MVVSLIRRPPRSARSVRTSRSATLRWLVGHRVPGRSFAEHESDLAGPVTRQPIGDVLLGHRVHRRGRVLEDEDLGVERDGTGQRHPLALTTGEHPSTFAHALVRTLGDVVTAGDPERLLGDGRIGVDVVGDAPVEQVGGVRRDDHPGPGQ